MVSDDSLFLLRPLVAKKQHPEKSVVFNVSPCIITLLIEVKMNCISIKVDVAPGSEIKVVAYEAVVLATKIGVSVTYVFNGVTCIADPGDDAEVLAKNCWDLVGIGIGMKATPQIARGKFINKPRRF